MKFKHVLVCMARKPNPMMPSCGAKGSDQIAMKFQEEVMKRGLQNVLVSVTGCLGACEMGPVVVVYPDGVWYGNVKPEDVEEIIEKHILGGEPVERLKITHPIEQMMA
ncbi:MAG TPA: (2Fe-2S) ferredoxin domain-containing protein [Aquificales bacterium]|nr:(2Fe-2S) ferredoxin domain-containing protein [Aquificales bacterium]HIO41698.1 (2Fe-2S) ferredoxin domain-containing protein [Aquifex sp.]